MSEEREVFFSLWLYVPLDFFEADERGYWNAYIDFHETWWGGPIFILGASISISPEEYVTLRGELSRFLQVTGEKVEDCYYFQERGGKFYVSPWKPMLGPGGEKGLPYHLYEKGRMPLEWFLLFHDDERVFQYSGWYGNIGYNTKLSKASDRLKKALDIIDKFSAEYRDRQQGSPQVQQLMRTGEELKIRLLELKGWFTYYPSSSSVVLDYSRAFRFVPPGELKDDRSSKEVWELLASMESGDIDRAIERQKALEERQRRIVAP